MTTVKRQRTAKPTTPRKASSAGARIVEGMREAVRWAQGEAVPVRQTTILVPTVDVRRVRRRLGLSQSEFAGKFGFSAASVKNWEQGRRRPEGPARVLLAVIDRHPDAVEDALRPVSA